MNIELINVEKIKCSKTRSLIRRSVEKGQQVLAGYTWKDRVRKGYFTDTKFAPAEVCTILLLTKKEIVVDIKGFWSFRKLVGFTFFGSLILWIKRRFFKKIDEAEVFGFIMHDSCHYLGFKHEKRKTRKTSVPYQIGYMSEDCFREMYE